MITGTELRIGNIVLSNRKPVETLINKGNINYCKILSIGLEAAVIHYIGEISGFEEFQSLYNDLNPVHLIPSLVEKCGFEPNGKDKRGYLLYRSKTSNFFPSLYTYANMWGVIVNERLNQFTYLHRLQNLYYSLTGEELKIQL